MCTRVLGIDPGPYDSAYVVWDGQKVCEHAQIPNAQLMQRLTGNGYDVKAIERVSYYGQTVGASVFETCEWVGRFDGECTARLIKRRDVRLYLCDTARCGDPQVRRAILDRYGAQGTKKNPGALYGVSKHEWSALAVAVTAWDQIEREEEK